MIIRKSSRRFALRAVALSCVAGVLGSAQALAADEYTQQQSLKVSYADLNLNSMKGATMLYQRIQGAAHLVCGMEGRSLVEQITWQKCYDGALGNAVTKVNNSLVTAVYRKQHGAAPATVTAMFRH